MEVVKRVILLLLMSLPLSVFAAETYNNVPLPLFTGPLLAPSGTTYPAGHVGYQPYIFYTDDFGLYGSRWKKESTLDTVSWNPTMVVFIGLTDRTDFELVFSYLINEKGSASDRGVGDFWFYFDYQLLKDIPHTWVPDLKLTVAEIFPTGLYDNLNPALNGTDALGAGSFQTAFALTFQKLWHLGGVHFLRGRWNFTYVIPADVHLHGFNAFGGGIGTDATLNLGNHFVTDLAFELTLTRRWVPAIDILYVASGKNTFSGNPGRTALGLPAMISTVSSEEVSIAPALEYNFNETYGIIAGVWLSLTGRNAEDFMSTVFSVVISL